MLSIVTPEVWVTANFKESQLDRMRPGQKVDIGVDAYPHLQLTGHVDSIQLGSGSRFTAFPPENATGNFVKIVQRVPVKIVIDSGLDPNLPLPLGLSVVPTVHCEPLRPRAGDLAGKAAVRMSGGIAATGAMRWRPSGSVWLIAGVATLAPFMEILDTTIVNVSLPHIAGTLSASNDDATWTLTSYLVANGIVVPIAGWLGRLIGRKRYFLICIAMFTVCSFLCGIATSLPQLVMFRLLQGLFGGGLQPSQQSIILDTFEPSQRGRAFSLVAIAMIFAPIIGPTLGGWITDNYSWRWVFLINVPVGIVAFIAGGATGRGPALGAARPGASARHRLWRPGADRARPRLAADDAGPRRGRRLVRLRRRSSSFGAAGRRRHRRRRRLAADGREAGGQSALL